MYNRLQGIVLGFLISALITSGISFAAQLQKTIAVTYRDIKLVTDGTEITPQDVNGNIVEPFIFNGTTYLPVRAVGEALGRDVDWDNDTSTVIVSGKPLKKVYLFSEIPTQINRSRFDVSKDGNENAIICTPETTTPDVSGIYDFEERLVYDVKGLAEKITGTIVQPKCKGTGSAKLRIVLRNENEEVLFKSDYVNSTDASPLDFEADITGCQKLIIEFVGTTTVSNPAAYSSAAVLNRDNCTCRLKNPAIYTTDY